MSEDSMSEELKNEAIEALNLSEDVVLRGRFEYAEAFDGGDVVLVYIGDRFYACAVFFQGNFVSAFYV